MSEITFFLLYLLAAATFGLSRHSKLDMYSKTLAAAGAVAGLLALLFHGYILLCVFTDDSGFTLSVYEAASIVGFEIAMTALIAASRAPLRGLAAALFLLAAATAVMTNADIQLEQTALITWHVKSHILVSLLSYGLLTVGAIVAVFALIHERRLRSGRLLDGNRFFAPLETMESLLFGIAATGFAGLLLAIVSGAAFVNNLFAQHLVHKTVFSLMALGVFGALLLGRHFAGWRGRLAVQLYLGGFFLLFLAYFGTRFVLEQILNRSWG